MNRYRSSVGAGPLGAGNTSFARKTAAFRQAHRRPDLVTTRGMPMKTGIADAYPGQLCENYRRFFYHYGAAPLLTMHTGYLYPVKGIQDANLLMARMMAKRDKQESYNLRE